MLGFLQSIDNIYPIYNNFNNVCLCNRKKFCDALASPCDVPTRTAILEAFVKFCQSVAVISTSYARFVRGSVNQTNDWLVK